MADIYEINAEEGAVLSSVDAVVLNWNRDQGVLPDDVADQNIAEWYTAMQMVDLPQNAAGDIINNAIAPADMYAQGATTVAELHAKMNGILGILNSVLGKYGMSMSVASDLSISFSFRAGGSTTGVLSTFGITYESAQGTPPSNRQSTSYMYSSYTLTDADLPELSADGYTFNGWTFADGATANVGDTISGNVTLTAVWEENEEVIKVEVIHEGETINLKGWDDTTRKVEVYVKMNGEPVKLAFTRNADGQDVEVHTELTGTLEELSFRVVEA